MVFVFNIYKNKHISYRIYNIKSLIKNLIGTYFNEKTQI